MTRRATETRRHPSRRDVLRGSAVTGAAVLTGSYAAAEAQSEPVSPPKSETSGAAGTQKTQAKTAGVQDISKLERVQQKLVRPPFAPEHDQVAQGAPKIVEIEMIVDERLMVVDEDTGASIWAMTYNGSVPGPLIIVHQDDYIEVTLKSLGRNTLEHNIDFHASTGALGGGALTHIYPGEECVLRFKATKPGCFTYHCAPGGAMIPYHVCHGMNGAIMVLPRDGLKDRDGNALSYDEIAYFGEQDYYLPKNADGTFKSYANAGDDYAESLEAMRSLIPSHSVFNGSVGALTGTGALHSKVGKTVLMIHNQANRDSRPHLIGGHGDYVWQTGSFSDAPETGLETWFVGGGSAAAALYTFEQPGVYAYVNHNLIEASILGATAHIVVDGDWNDDLMTQVVEPRQIQS